MLNDKEQNLKISIDCLEECSTKADLNRHKKKCSIRNQNKATEPSHTHETARVLWKSIKNNGLASSLLKIINDDLINNSQAEFGITKLRSGVCVQNVDVFGLDNSSSLHFAKKQDDKHQSRRKDDDISLSSADIRLIAGPGQSINSIKKMVTQLHKHHIPTEKGVVETIRSERQDVTEMCENIVCHDVHRRSKNLAGQSHLGLV